MPPVACLLTGEAELVKPYRLAPGDRITVIVFGEPDLSGDFLVDGGGSVSLPLIGATSVNNLTLQESEELITKRLVDGYLQKPSVSVRINELRAIYVTGDVRTPGSFPFKFGATVLSAIASAGGLDAAQGPAKGAAAADFLVADERLRGLENDRRALLVKLARLEAQRDERATFDAPDLQGEKGGEAATLILGEREIFDDQRQALDGEVELLRLQKPRLQSEIEALEAEIEAEKQQQRLTQGYLDDYTKLMDKGLGVKLTDLQLKRDLAINQTNLSKYAADRAHLELSFGELDIKILNAQNLYRRRVIDELADTRAKLRAIEVALPTTRKLREIKLDQADPALEAGASKPQRSFFVIRKSGNQVLTLNATEGTLLEPGDVVEVRRSPPSDQESPATSILPRGEVTGGL